MSFWKKLFGGNPESAAAPFSERAEAGDQSPPSDLPSSSGVAHKEEKNDMKNFKIESNGWCYEEGAECEAAANGEGLVRSANAGVTAATWVRSSQPSSSVQLKGLIGCPGCRGLMGFGPVGISTSVGSSEKVTALCLRCRASVEVRICVRGTGVQPKLFLVATSGTARPGIHLEEVIDPECVAKAGPVVAELRSIARDLEVDDRGEIIELDLGETSVRDETLAKIKGLMSLKKLSLHKTQIGDAGLAQLKGLKVLEQLGLDGTRVSDDGLVQIQGLSGLAWLTLNNTSVSDSGLAHLRPLQNLRMLQVGHTRVTDAGMAVLAEIQSLEVLNIESIRVTNSGLEKLLSLKKLRIIRAGGTQVTDDGVRKFKTHLPNCEIHK